MVLTGHDGEKCHFFLLISVIVKGCIFETSWSLKHVKVHCAKSGFDLDPELESKPNIESQYMLKY